MRKFLWPSQKFKFSISEKATKISAICLKYGYDIYLVDVKTIRQIAQIFVAFSEKLNFTKSEPWNRFYKILWKYRPNEHFCAWVYGKNLIIHQHVLHTSFSQFFPQLTFHVFFRDKHLWCKTLEKWGFNMLKCLSFLFKPLFRWYGRNSSNFLGGFLENFRDQKFILKLPNL